MKDIQADFFRRDPVTCARELIGCLFRWNGCVGRIVETEAYAAVGDKACHTWSRPSSRKFVEQHPAGAAYVYLNYGMHWLFNVLVKGPEEAGFVLIRALEPVEGVAEMIEKCGPKVPRLLCAGPGRLTKALGIGAQDHGRDFLSRQDTGISQLSEDHTVQLVAGPRIGISKDIERPWRFVDNRSLSLSRKGG